VTRSDDGVAAGKHPRRRRRRLGWREAINARVSRIRRARDLVADGRGGVVGRLTWTARPPLIDRATVTTTSHVARRSIGTTSPPGSSSALPPSVLPPSSYPETRSIPVRPAHHVRPDGHLPATADLRRTRPRRRRHPARYFFDVDDRRRVYYISDFLSHVDVAGSMRSRREATGGAMGQRGGLVVRTG